MNRCGYVRFLRRSSLCGIFLLSCDAPMVVYLHDETALIEWYPRVRQVGEHIMWDGSRFDMVEKDFHWGCVEKIVVLGIEFEMVRMKMDDERRGIAVVLLQDI